jgi:methionine-rich copper-binding protein CopC
MNKVLGLSALLLLGLSAPAFAHSYLKDSDPSRGATLKTAPAEVTIDFTEGVAPRFSGITVEDSAGQRVDRGDVHPEGKEGTRLGVGLGALKPGVYTVHWHAVSADDGHKTQGSFHFTVAPAP